MSTIWITCSLLVRCWQPPINKQDVFRCGFCDQFQRSLLWTCVRNKIHQSRVLIWAWIYYNARFIANNRKYVYSIMIQYSWINVGLNFDEIGLCSFKPTQRIWCRSTYQVWKYNDLMLICVMDGRIESAMFFEGLCFHYNDVIMNAMA